MNFLYIGHRGTRKNYDENTIGAFSRALNIGANCIELDIHKTEDDKIVVIHDPTFDRTTNGHGLVRDSKYSEIKALRTTEHNEEIPLLTDILSKFEGKVKFMIELKGENVLDSLLTIIDPIFLSRKIISSRKVSELKTIKEKVSNAKICYNITKGIGLSLEKFLDLGKKGDLLFNFDMVSLRASLVEKRFIETCHKNKILALSWDFMKYDNPLEKQKHLIKLGIDGILFDDYKNIKPIKKMVK